MSIPTLKEGHDALMNTFTCQACGNEATAARRLREGLVCTSCATFLVRSEESFEEPALRYAEETRRIRASLSVAL